MTTNTWALVTGATSGIGLEFAHILARDGINLYIVSRHQSDLENVKKELEETYKVTVTPIVQDLSVTHGAAKVFKHITSPIHILINSAGFGLYGFFSETNFERERAMIELNIVALTELTKLVLPQMIAAKSGKILNVASTASFQPGPRMAIYYATKAYVLSFSQAIAEELQGAGVTVTTLCPGPTKTHFESVAQLGSSKLFKRFSLMDPAEVARVGYEALKSGDRLVIPGIRNRLFAWATRLIPIAVAAKIAEYIQRPT